MKIYYFYTKLKYNGHDTLIKAMSVPNWVERFFLRRTNKLTIYIGRGNKWIERDAQRNHHHVSSAIAKRLESIERGVLQDHKDARSQGRTFTKAIHLWLAIMLFMVGGCYRRVDERSYAIGSSGSVSVIKVEGCEYLIWNNSIIHKANCLNHDYKFHCDDTVHITDNVWADTVITRN